MSGRGQRGGGRHQGGRDGGRGRDDGGGRGRGRGRGDGGGRGRGDGGGRGRGDGGRGRGRGRGNPTDSWGTVEAGIKANVSTMQQAATVEGKQPKGDDTLQLAVRPDQGGSVGRKLTVFPNHYAVQISGAGHAYHYDVVVKPAGEDRYGADDAPTGPEGPDRLPKKLTRAILNHCAEEHKWPKNSWAYDGRKSLYSPKDFLPKAKHVFPVKLPGGRGDKEFEVVTTLANTMNLMDLATYTQRKGGTLPLVCVQCIEVALRYTASQQPSCFAAGRSLFFNNAATNYRLSGGSELWLGYHQSVRPCQLGLTLNIDTTAGAFLQERSVIEVLGEAAGCPIDNLKKGITEFQRRNMRKAMSGLMIVTTHRANKNETRKVKGFTKESAQKQLFSDKSGKSQSIAAYWSKAGYPALKYPFLPCLDVSRGKKENFLPPEVCRIATGQRRMKMTDDQQRSMVSFTAKKPEERRKGINDVLRTANLSNNPLVKSFGIKVDSREVQVTARLLPQPHLQYTKPGSLDTGTRGAWNLEGIKFLKPGVIKGWGVVNFAQRNRVMVEGEQGLVGFLLDLMNMLADLGMNVPKSKPPIVHGDSRGGTLGPMSECLELTKKEYGQVNLLLVLLPSKDSALYNSVKHSGNVTLGVVTQCFVTKSAGVGMPPRGRLQYVANLGMKINHKVGGVNTKVAGKASQTFPVIGTKPFIVFGADVTHPTGFDSSEPSVAAVVATMDEVMGQYETRIVLQEHRQEIIDLKKPAKELLISFYQRTKVKPEAIIFYRDGVDEGSFLNVLKTEYNDLRAACEELEAGYTPPITFVVAQKRHHTRFNPDNPRDGDRNGNIMPGTVVDTGIVGPNDFEFFLNSHAGIQGTNKAGHYHVLCDENGFGSDGIQLMTFWSSYLYCRCTRSVSYATPAYYAHLAAYQGKILVHESSSDADLTDPVSRARINDRISHSMFFV